MNTPATMQTLPNPSLDVALCAISSDQLERFLAVWTASADQDRSGAVLAGLSLSYDGAILTIAATDGKILVEETLATDNLHREVWSVIIANDAMKTLKAWVKSIPLSHRVTIARGPKSIRLVCSGAAIELRTVEGNFPQYKMALSLEGKANPVEYVGLNVEYMARLHKLWKGQGNAMRCDMRRGIICKPMRLSNFCLSQVALVMPISLPT